MIIVITCYDIIIKNIIKNTKLVILMVIVYQADIIRVKNDNGSIKKITRRANLNSGIMKVH